MWLEGFEELPSGGLTWSWGPSISLPCTFQALFQQGQGPLEVFYIIINFFKGHIHPFELSFVGQADKFEELKISIGDQDCDGWVVDKVGFRKYDITWNGFTIITTLVRSNVTILVGIIRFWMKKLWLSKFSTLLSKMSNSDI